MNRAGLVFVPLFLVWAARVTIPRVIHRPLYGIWAVEASVPDDLLEATRNSDPTRLRSITFDVSGSTSVLTNSNASLRYRARVDTLAHRITMTECGDTVPLRWFAYTRPDTMHLVLSEATAQDSTILRLRRMAGPTL